MKRRILIGLAIALLMSACSGSPDRSDAVAVAVDDVIVPAFVDAAETAATLDTAVEDLCSVPTGAALISAQSAWHDALAAWHRTEIGWGGPVDMARIDSEVHFRLTDPATIEDFLAAHAVGAPIDVNDELAATQKGLGAIEYLMFEDDLATVVDPARCDLMMSLSAAVTEEIDGVVAAWTVGWEDGPAYADELAGRTDDAMDSNDALGELGENIVLILKDATLVKLGRQLGITSANPEPDALGEGPAGAGAEELAARIDGIARIYTTTDESGFGALVAAASTDVDNTIRSDLTTADELIDRFPADEPFADGLAEQPEDAEALYDVLAELRRTFETDVVSLLDITLGFSDTDGDTG